MASNTTVAEHGTEQMSMRQSNDSNAPDSKPAAVELGNSSVSQSQVPPPAPGAVNGGTWQKVAPSGIPGAAPHTTTTDGPAPPQLNNEKSGTQATFIERNVRS